MACACDVSPTCKQRANTPEGISEGLEDANGEADDGNGRREGSLSADCPLSANQPAHQPHRKSSAQALLTQSADPNLTLSMWQRYCGRLRYLLLNQWCVRGILCVLAPPADRATISKTAYVHRIFSRMHRTRAGTNASCGRLESPSKEIQKQSTTRLPKAKARLVD